MQRSNDMALFPFGLVIWFTSFLSVAYCCWKSKQHRRTDLRSSDLNFGNQESNEMEFGSNIREAPKNQLKNCTGFYVTGYCHNGGTCNRLDLRGGKQQLLCQCPVPFLGDRCQETATSASVGYLYVILPVFFAIFFGVVIYMCYKKKKYEARKMKLKKQFIKKSSSELAWKHNRYYTLVYCKRSSEPSKLKLTVVKKDEQPVQHPISHDIAMEELDSNGRMPKRANAASSGSYDN